jgi:hypothetical protein
MGTLLKWALGALKLLGLGVAVAVCVAAVGFSFVVGVMGGF